MLLSYLTRPLAATPENPKFSLNDPAAWDALGAQPAASGVRVNRHTALQYSPYYRALSLISGAFAKLPCVVYKRRGAGKAADPAHPAYRLLRWKPNQNQTAFVWKRQMQVQALTEGNGYSYVFRDAAARPLELVPLDPTKTFPVIEGGRLWYVTEVGVQKRKLAAEDVLHFAGLSYDGIMGLSIVECAREALGLGMGAQRYGSIFFKNSARPSVALLHPLKLTKETKQELREGWERMHTGLDAAHRTAILDGGLTIKELSVNAQQAQLVELLKLNWIDLANFFDLPPHKLGNRDATSYASLEQENQAFLDDCLDTRLVPTEEQFRDKLLTEEEKDGDTHAVEFDRKHLIKANMQTRSAYFRTALGGRPWMTMNEVRAEEGLNPSEDEGADEVLQPLNMGSGGGQNDPADPADDNKKPSSAEGDGRRELLAAQRPLLAETVRRMVRRVAGHGGRLERAARTPSTYMAWLESLDAEHGEAFRLALDPVEAACRAALGRDVSDVSVAAWTLWHVTEKFHALADASTPAALPAEARRLAAELEAGLPALAVETFLGTDEGPALAAA